MLSNYRAPVHVAARGLYPKQNVILPQRWSVFFFFFCGFEWEGAGGRSEMAHRGCLSPSRALRQSLSWSQITFSSLFLESSLTLMSAMMGSERTRVVGSVVEMVAELALTRRINTRAVRVGKLSTEGGGSREVPLRPVISCPHHCLCVRSYKDCPIKELQYVLH